MFLNKENITSALHFIASCISTVNIYFQQVNEKGNKWLGLTSNILCVIVLVFSTLVIQLTKSEKTKLTNDLETLSNQVSARSRNEPIDMRTPRFTIDVVYNQNTNNLELA